MSKGNTVRNGSPLLRKNPDEAKVQSDEKKLASSGIPSGGNSGSQVPSKPPARDDRNFRSHYYEKVGFRGMDERKTLELILRDDPVNLEKCVNFSLRCSIPASERLLVWKILLCEEAMYPNNRKSFSRWKERLFRDCQRFLRSAGRLENGWPPAQKLTVLWLFFDVKLNLDYKAQLSEPYCQDFMALAECCLTMTENNELEAFWLAKGMSSILRNPPEEVYTELIQIYHRILSTNKGTVDLYRHLEKIGLNEEIPLRSWMGRGYAKVLREAPLQRIWDKLACGALRLLVFVSIALVDVNQTSLLSCQTAKEAIRCLTSNADDVDEIIAQKSIELWMSDGSFLLPHIDSNTNKRPEQRLNSQAIVSNRLPVIGVPKFQLMSCIQINTDETS